MTYVGAEQDLIDLWVEAKIEGAIALDTISAGLTSRVFNLFAPTGTTYPFIIYQAQTPPRDIRGVGPTRVMVDTTYIVKAITQSTDFHVLRDIARILDVAMTNAWGENVTGGVVFSSIREAQFSLVEVEDGVQFRHFGGEYRIQARAEDGVVVDQYGGY